MRAVRKEYYLLRGNNIKGILKYLVVSIASIVSIKTSFKKGA